MITGVRSTALGITNDPVILTKLSSWTE